MGKCTWENRSQAFAENSGAIAGICEALLGKQPTLFYSGSTMKMSLPYRRFFSLMGLVSSFSSSFIASNDSDPSARQPQRQFRGGLRIGSVSLRW